MIKVKMKIPPRVGGGQIRMSVVIFGNIRESSFVDEGSCKNRPFLNLVNRASRDKLAS